MLEILLIRHGQTDWNVERKIMGNLPIGLNEVGKQQIQTLAHFLEPATIDAIYYSPLLRTTESAQLLNQKRNLNLQEEKDLREIECGHWIGKTFQAIKASTEYVPYYHEPHLRIGESGESLQMVQERGVKVIETLRKQFSQGRLALVSHADWIKCVLLHYLKVPLTQIPYFRIDNASLSYLQMSSQEVRVIAINHHLEVDRLFTFR